MTQEVLKLSQEALAGLKDVEKQVRELVAENRALKEALAQTQEPVAPPWWPAVENILNEYGLQAIDFVADFKQALAQTQDGQCKRCTDGCPACDARKLQKEAHDLL